MADRSQQRRALRSAPAGHLAGVRFGVGLPGPPPRDPRRPGDGRRRLRVVPGGARCRDAVRRPGAARRRRRHREQCPRRCADRPATRRQRDRAGCHHRCQPAGPGRGSPGHQRAGPVRAGPHPPDLVAAARRLPGRGRCGAGDAGDRASTAGRAGLASASCSGAPAGTEDLRNGPAVPDRGLDDQRVLPHRHRGGWRGLRYRDARRLSHGERPGHSRPARQPDRRLLHRVLRGVQHPRRGRRGGHHAFRPAPDRPGLLHGDRRARRGGSGQPDLPQALNGRPLTDCLPCDL